MQDLGEKLRIVVTAHRRVKITSQIFEKHEAQAKADETSADKRRRKHKYRNRTNMENYQQQELSDIADVLQNPSNTKEIQQVLMVEVINIQHEPYKQTEEIKALTQEIIKTIRDIITMNPLYR